MTERTASPDPARVAFLRALPLAVKQNITGEEAQQFIAGEEIPESLYLKIKDYLVEVDE